MKQANKWIITALTLCCFSQISLAETTKFQKELDDFAWSLGEQHKKKLASGLLPEKIAKSYQNSIQTFMDKHHQNYQKARTESLKKWQVSKIDTSGFKQIRAGILDEDAQELSQTPLPGISNEHLLVIQNWKILTVESMSNIVASYASSHLIWNSSGEPAINLSSLSRTYYLFGIRHATVPLENDVWEVWSYSQGLAYRYKWDLRQNQITDLSIWLEEESLKQTN